MQINYPFLPKNRVSRILAKIKIHTKRAKNVKFFAQKVKTEILTISLI